jgi:hypothetical protein
VHEIPIASYIRAVMTFQFVPEPERSRRLQIVLGNISKLSVDDSYDLLKAVFKAVDDRQLPANDTLMILVEAIRVRMLDHWQMCCVTRQKFQIMVMYRGPTGESLHQVVHPWVWKRMLDHQPQRLLAATAIEPKH